MPKCRRHQKARQMWLDLTPSEAGLPEVRRNTRKFPSQQLLFGRSSKSGAKAKTISSIAILPPLSRLGRESCFEGQRHCGMRLACGAFQNASESQFRNAERGLLVGVSSDARPSKCRETWQRSSDACRPGCETSKTCIREKEKPHVTFKVIKRH